MPRPRVDVETVDEMDDALADVTEVPPERLKFGQKLEVLLARFDARGEEIAELRERLDEEGSRGRIFG